MKPFLAVLAAVFLLTATGAQAGPQSGEWKLGTTNTATLFVNNAAQPVKVLLTVCFRDSGTPPPVQLSFNPPKPGLTPNIFPANCLSLTLPIAVNQAAHLMPVRTGTATGTYQVEVLP